jgi:hypothetical protein
MSIQTYAAFHMLYHGGCANSRFAVSRRLKSIRVISLQLADPGLAMSDSTIAAIALLVKADIDMTDYRHQAMYRNELDVHLSGLLALVRRRGGLSSLPSWLVWLVCCKWTSL